MGTYDSIIVPIQGQPISSSLYGIAVRNAIIDLDLRMSFVESTLANYAYKAAATTRASLTTPSNDPDLVLDLEANSKYFVEVFVSYAALNSADLLTSWAVPAGVTTANRRVLGVALSPSATYGLNATATTQEGLADGLLIRLGTHNYSTTVSYNGSRNSSVNQQQIQEIGLVATGATAGQVAFQWSQAVSNATGTIMSADSFMRATKLV